VQMDLMHFVQRTIKKCTRVKLKMNEYVASNCECTSKRYDPARKDYDVRVYLELRRHHRSP
jgi:hypothetical protein